jgi:hypothetical protein
MQSAIVVTKAHKIKHIRSLLIIPALSTFSKSISDYRRGIYILKTKCSFVQPRDEPENQENEIAGKQDIELQRGWVQSVRPR